MDNNTLLFHDKGAGVFKGISIYPNRIEAVVKNDFFGTHTKIVYLKDITGVNGVKGKRVFLRNRFLQAEQSLPGSGICQRAQYGDVTGRFRTQKTGMQGVAPCIPAELKRRRCMPLKL